MKYTTEILISAGESDGFGLKIPCNYILTFQVNAINSISAYMQSYLIAYEKLKGTLTNPNDQCSRAKIQKIFPEKGESVNLDGFLLDLEISSKQQMFSVTLGESVFFNKFDLVTKIANHNPVVYNAIMSGDNSKAILSELKVVN
jgi:hypothetical protein